MFHMFHLHSSKDINHFLPLDYSIWRSILHTFSVRSATCPVQSDMALTIEELYTVLPDLPGNVLILQHLIPCRDIWLSSIHRYYTTWIQPLCFILPISLCLSNCQRQTSDVRQAGMQEPLYIWNNKTQALGQQDLEWLKKKNHVYYVVFREEVNAVITTD